MWMFVGLELYYSIKYGGAQRNHCGISRWWEGSKPAENVYEPVVSSHLLSSVLRQLKVYL